MANHNDQSGKKSGKGIPPIMGQAAAMFVGGVTGKRAGAAVASYAAEHLHLPDAQASASSTTAEAVGAAIIGLASMELGRRNPNKSVVLAASTVAGLQAFSGSVRVAPEIQGLKGELHQSSTSLAHLQPQPMQRIFYQTHPSCSTV